MQCAGWADRCFAATPLRRTVQAAQWLGWANTTISISQGGRKGSTETDRRHVKERERGRGGERKLASVSEAVTRGDNDQLACQTSYVLSDMQCGILMV